MKKIWKICQAFSLLFLLGALLSACGEEKGEQSGREFSVYYLNREETKIVRQEVLIQDEECSQETQVRTLLEALQQTPGDVSLKASVGVDFKVNSYRIEEGQLDLDVDEAYRKLSPTTEVLARAALVRTLTQVDGINHVLMSVGGQTLTDRSGAVVGPMTAAAFIDNAGEEINTYEMVTLQLYFANQAGDRLVAVGTTKEYNSNISLEKLVVDCLVKGPDMEGAYPVLNPAAKVLGVTVKDGTCYVNFDAAFLTQIYNVTAEVVVYSIVNSLVELPNVNKVQISVEGKTDLIFRETFPLATIYERNLDLTKPEEAQTETQTETQTEPEEPGEMESAAGEAAAGGDSGRIPAMRLQKGVARE